MDRRSFTQRGVKTFRILPCEIAGIKIRLAHADVASKREALRFGAALLENVEFIMQKTEATFLVTDVTSPNLPEQIENSLTSAHGKHCAAAVFPELTINRTSRSDVQLLLREKPWIDKVTNEPCPNLDFVVAGSWHEQEGADVFNVMTVFDGVGDELVRHRKLFAAREEGLIEGIKPGQEITVLIVRDILYTFGICLDFAQEFMTSLFERLDVDFVIIASCGNRMTMQGHMNAAQRMYNYYRTGTLIVHHPYPPLGAGRYGYVLDPGANPSKITTEEWYAESAWLVFEVGRYRS
jgi:predicted amidohydrolase